MAATPDDRTPLNDGTPQEQTMDHSNMDHSNDTERLDATTVAPAESPSRGILTGTVVWGLILLVVAALYGAQVAAELGVIAGFALSPAWIVLGLGALLVIGGIVAAIARRR